MKARSLLSICLPIATTLLLSSCAHIARERPEPQIALPDDYGASGGAESFSARWWESFADPELERLISEALAGNLALSQAAARLEQARALAEQAGADLAPDISLEGGALRARNLIANPQGGRTVTTANQFRLGLAASYEIDLWGRIGALSRAARRDFDASAYELQTAALSLVAQVADLWYAIGSLVEQVALLESQISSGAEQLRLVELRFATGQATALDVYQQRGQVASLNSIRPQLESALAIRRQQLAILLGRPPRSSNDLGGGNPPELAAIPALGLPAELLRQRPDLLAAAERLRAADERVAAAVANRFPSLRLSASAGYSAPELGELFDDWIWQLAGNIVAPLIDGGSRRAQLAAREAALAERIAQYSEIILKALGEVEGALVEERKQAELVVSRARQLEIAEKTLAQALSRYRKGLSDYLAVLQALQSKQELERRLIEDRRQVLQYRIALYRALGGDFSELIDQDMKMGDEK
jgi:NodT family efflux transporter outer membrane factor (OMF) lipoprotein